jgi:hypothetical protein
MAKLVPCVLGILVMGTSACSHIAWGVAAPVRHEPSCETHEPLPGERRNVSCLFFATGQEQRVTFKVLFLGSHDDTRLSMTPLLNNQPLTCDLGSKTSSQFEDGDIALECTFSAKASVNSRQVLEMAITWTHAQYAGFEMSGK